MPSEPINPNAISGPHKAAIFLLAMGKEITQRFFKKADPGTIKKIGESSFKHNFSQMSFKRRDIV